MPHYLHQFAFYLHILAGSLSLVVFWLPLLTKKGNKNHKRAGKLFVNTMYLVAFSGVLMSSLVMIDPISVRNVTANLTADETANFVYQNRVFAGFLFMLSILVFCNVRQSILVLKAKANRSELKAPIHISSLVFLGLLGFGMGLVGLTKNILLFDIFAILCLVISGRCLHYIYKAQIKEREWIIAHLSNICAAGIASYTAFLSFGGRRLFAEIFTGNLQVIPWILPGIIGAIGITYMSKKFIKQFRVISSTSE